MSQKQKSQEKAFTLSDNLTIIEQLIEQLVPQNLLKVIVNDDPMISNQLLSQNQGNVVYTYELIGSKSLRKTQNNNLLQKLQLMEKKQSENLRFKAPLTNKQKEKDKRSQTVNQQEPLQPKQPKISDQNDRTMYRYFTENIKCFRCKKTGHYDYACLDQFSCAYCLSSSHHSQRCPQKIVCFRCYNYGHMVNQCLEKQDGPFCQNCKRKHFNKCSFLMKGTQQVKQMFIMDSLYNHQDIRCLKCFKYGHYNCEMMEGTGGGYYKRSYQPSGDRGGDRGGDRSNDRSRDKYYGNSSKKHKY